jgi:2-oxoglutarate ferredoxin oxidoreductase subunit delta
VRQCLPEEMFGQIQNHQQERVFPAEMEHPENCIGCAMCYMMCPDIAITVIKE